MINEGFCECGHHEEDHAGPIGKVCNVDRCPCLRFRRPPPPPPKNPGPPNGANYEPAPKWAAPSGVHHIPGPFYDGDVLYIGAHRWVGAVENGAITLRPEREDA